MVQAASEKNYIGGRKLYLSMELGWETWKLGFSSGARWRGMADDGCGRETVQD